MEVRKRAGMGEGIEVSGRDSHCSKCAFLSTIKTLLIRAYELQTPRSKGRQMWAPINADCIFQSLKREHPVNQDKLRVPMVSGLERSHCTPFGSRQG